MADELSPEEAERRREAAPEKMPATKPHADIKAKPKPSPRPPATKADIAAQKRMDKTVIKRMRKR